MKMNPQSKGQWSKNLHTALARSRPRATVKRPTEATVPSRTFVLLLLPEARHENIPRGWKELERSEPGKARGTKLSLDGGVVSRTHING